MKSYVKILAVSALVLVVIAGTYLGVRYGTQSGGTTQSDGASAEQTQSEDGTQSGDGTTVAAASVNTEAVLSDDETQIVLDGDSITVTGTGASVSGTTVTITEFGTYYISGTLENGQIYVDAGGGDMVVLSFGGVTIYNETEAVVYVENAGLTQIVLEDGTTNCVQSGAETDLSTVDDSADESASGGAIYAKDDLSITGGGTLQVYGYINNGIQTSNNLVIESGTIEVTAVNNGIKGKDSVTITGGTFSITSGGDGMKSDDTTGEGYGVVTISGGTFDIVSSSDGIQAETLLTISGGTFSVVTGGGSADVTYSSFDNWGRTDFSWDMESESETSTKGLKGGTQVNITGGTFTVDAYDDAIHSNGVIAISGGTFAIAAGDDAIHADNELTITDGDINVTASYEGLEANQILISGGNISVVSSDDGMNANGGSSQWGWSTSASDEEMPTLRITGGTIYVNSDGDGLDSNGDLYVEGGTVVVDGPSDSGNGAIDSGSENGGVCEVSGSIVIAVGSSGMAETFDSGSEQCSFLYQCSSYSAGTEITISDADGNVLYQHTAAKSGSCIVFSSPDLVLGETYYITVGSETGEITLSSNSTSSGQSLGQMSQPGQRGQSGQMGGQRGQMGQP